MGSTRLLVIVLVLGSAATAYAEDPDRIPLPEDPTVVVLSWAERPPQAPSQGQSVIAIRADGTASVMGKNIDPKVRVSATELQALLKFAVHERRFFEIEQETLDGIIEAEKDEGTRRFLAGSPISVLRVATAEQTKELRVRGLYLASVRMPEHTVLGRLMALRNRLSSLSNELRSRDREERFLREFTEQERATITRVTEAARKLTQDRENHTIGAVVPFHHDELERRLPHLRFFNVETIGSEVREYLQFGEKKSQVVYHHAYRLAIHDAKSETIRLYERTMDFKRIWPDFDLVAQTKDEAEELFFLHRLIGRLVGGTIVPGTGQKWHLMPDVLRKTLKVRAEDYRHLELPMRVVRGKTRFHCIRMSLLADDWDMPLHLHFRVVWFEIGSTRFNAFREKLQSPTFPEGTKLEAPAVKQAIEKYLKARAGS